MFYGTTGCYRGTSFFHHEPKKLRMRTAAVKSLRRHGYAQGLFANGLYARTFGNHSNNLAENAVRPLKLGAKNWLFFGSQHAGHNAAVIYTLVENCRRHGIPVEEYLCELLTRLPGETDLETIASLTPARKAAARREKSAAA